ncbi:hypothetical protein ACH3XW_45935 [Acanthocheilonema viteae]
MSYAQISSVYQSSALQCFKSLWLIKLTIEGSKSKITSGPPASKTCFLTSNFYFLEGIQSPKMKTGYTQLKAKHKFTRLF